MNKLNLNIEKIVFLFFLVSCQISEPTNNIERLSSVEEEQNYLVKKQIVDSTIHIDYLLGKFDPKMDSRFVLIDKEHSNRNDRLMRKEAYAAFLEMQKAANADGVKFIIISATRNFDYQKGIWERKWTGATKVDDQDLSKTIADPKTRALRILQYSSMPGTSRHHWGTDIDINSFNNEYFKKGKGKKEYDWLTANANKFGFCQPYTPKDLDGRTGYQEERWHWSYLPLATKLTEQAALRIKEEMISGFLGSEQAKEIGVVKKYILGINDKCKQQ